MNNAEVLHADGLLLRPFLGSDAAAFTEAVLESVDKVGRWMPWCTSAYTENDALDWFAFCDASRKSGSAFEFGVFCRTSGQLLGGAGLNQIIQLHRFCNLGYWVRQSRQGEGIAPRCVQSLAAHAFESLMLERVEIVVAVGNKSSEAVAEKAGGLREGIARNRLQLRGEAVPAHVFSLVPGGAA